MCTIWRSKVASNQSGATILEFALVAIIVLSLLFAIVDLSLMLFANLAMQHAVRSGARYAVTGREDIDPGGRRLAVIKKIEDSSIGLCKKNHCTVAFYRLNPDGSVSSIPADPDNPNRCCCRELFLDAFNPSYQAFLPGWQIHVHGESHNEK